MVRDLAHEKEKEINVEIIGDHFLIDKRILEELKDPLVHLIRNCADHGIESRLQREKSGKEKNGKILIKVSKEADAKLSLLVSDDGGGIRVDKIVNSAIKNGVIDEERASLLSDDEKVNLIFSSGVSSSEMITEISGRGLGMAIVAEKISNLGGSVHVKSQEGKGTTFIIKIPQTIATFRALLVRCGEKRFLIPTLFIDKVVGVNPDDILTSGHRASLIVSGEHIGLVDLGLSLGLNETSSKNLKMLPALILNSNGRRMAFKVDEILEEIEGIIKPLGDQLKNVKKITGVTMVGNGILIPVVNVSELIEYAVGGVNSGSDKIKAKGLTDQKQRILIVEDSITVRSMLKSIVESAGYETEVAVDGVDGYNKLTNGNFDAVVTDIEMPNMNGFELTSKIKGDKKFSDIPVILVTTLESQKDMQRGLEAGADAYIVKGSFEKSNLTDTIRRLI
jgi:two-component system chemotaxis sensor kinase CheA